MTTDKINYKPISYKQLHYLLGLSEVEVALYFTTQEYACIVVMVNKVYNHFKSDFNKTCLWFSSVNLHLGNIRSIDLLKIGKVKRVNQLINYLLEQNNEE